MNASDYTISFAVDQKPGAVFEAINNVRAWWSETIEGVTDKPGATFTYRYRDVHQSTQKISEFVPGKKVVWHVTEARINFVQDQTEWVGTDIVFEIGRKGKKTELRFTHVGLTPTVECYGKCSGAWSFYINESLRQLIISGKGQPDTAEES